MYIPGKHFLIFRFGVGIDNREDLIQTIPYRMTDDFYHAADLPLFISAGLRYSASLANFLPRSLASRARFGARFVAETALMLVWRGGIKAGPRVRMGFLRRMGC